MLIPSEHDDEEIMPALTEAVSAQKSHRELIQTTNEMQQLFRLLVFFLISPTCFGRQICPSSGAPFECIYGFWYNALTLPPTGVIFRQQCRCIVPKAVYTLKRCA